MSLNTDNESGVQDDPWALLGVSPKATDEEVRAAYLAKVREHPPDRSPETFERVRDAYELLRDRRRRARVMLLRAGVDAPLVSLLAARTTERRFAGPDPWLTVLREK